MASLMRVVALTFGLIFLGAVPAFAKGGACAAAKTQADCGKKTGCSWNGKACAAAKAAKPAKTAAKPAKGKKETAKTKGKKPAETKPAESKPTETPAAEEEMPAAGDDMPPPEAEGEAEDF